MTINITQEDIKKGKKRDCATCPVALGMKRAGLYGAVYPAEYFDYVKRFYIRLPQEAINFIKAFDGDLLVEPFSFSLTLPD